MNGNTNLSHLTRSAAILLVAIGFSLLLASVVRAQAQLPGVAVTSGPGNDFRPVWSPDGNTITFFSNRAGDNDIWLVNQDKSGLRQLTQGPADDRRPSWSPDGRWIVFDSDRSGNNDVWVVSASGGDPIQITDDRSFDSFPAWSPDGRQIAYFGYEDGVLDLRIVALTSTLPAGQPGQPQRLIDSLADEKHQECTYACHVPAWSPDGGEIAYGQGNHTQVWVVDADGSNPHPVGDYENHMHFPWWTPDGKLLMLSEHKNDRQESVNDVWEVEADGSHPTLLYSNIPHGGPFYWNPANMQEIAFHSPRAGNFDIYITNLSGTQPGAPLVTAALTPTPASGPAVVAEAPGDENKSDPPAGELPAQEKEPRAGGSTFASIAFPVAALAAFTAFVAVVLLAGLAVAVNWLRRR